MYRIKSLPLLFLFLLLFSCRDRDIDYRALRNYETGITYPLLEPAARGDLLHYEKITSISKNQINENFEEYDFSGYILYDIDLYRVYYSSLQSGKAIVLSGMIMVPKLDEQLPHYQYHHSTVFPVPLDHSYGALDVPSLYEGGGPGDLKVQYEVRLLCAIPASRGFFVSAPDYGGYSISKDIEHPYVYHPELSNQSVDLVLASQEFADKQNITLSGKLFLAGWSEGGGVALATHKLIEEKYSDRINISASAPFAGEYNIKELFNYVMSSKHRLSGLRTFNWLVYNMNKYSKTPLPAEKIWITPVSDQYDVLNISSNFIKDIYQPSFINEVLDGASLMITESKKNSLHENWTPGAKVFLHSGKYDQIVVHDNSLAAYHNFVSNGADVKLYEYNGNHYSSLYQYLFNIIKDFSLLK